MFSNVALDEAERLYALVRALRPAVSVEIGLAQGTSALAIAQAVADNGVGRHHVIDPFQRDFGYAGVAQLERAGLSDVVEFHEAFPEEVIPGLPALGFAFVDGWHVFDLSLFEFVLIDKRLDVDGVIGFHDLWMPALQKVLRYILTNRHYELHHDVALLELTQGQRRRSQFASVAQRIPKAAELFAPEILHPTAAELDVRHNMVFVEKLADDDRTWTAHSAF
jgi:hypothetical protein